MVKKKPRMERTLFINTVYPTKGEVSIFIDAHFDDKTTERLLQKLRERGLDYEDAMQIWCG